MASGIADQLHRQWTQPGQTLPARVNRRARDPPEGTRKTSSQPTSTSETLLPTNSSIVRKKQHHRANTELVELSVLPYNPRPGLTATLAGAQTHPATYPLNE